MQTRSVGEGGGGGGAGVGGGGGGGGQKKHRGCVLRHMYIEQSVPRNGKNIPKN